MQAGSVPKVIVKWVQELSTVLSLGCCVKTPVTASSRGVHCICNTLCVGPSQNHTNDLETLQLSLCQAVLSSSLSLHAQHENQLLWTPMKLLLWVSHLCQSGRGNSGSKLMWIFMGLDFPPKINPPSSRWTPWWAFVQIVGLSATTVNLSGCPRPLSEAWMFCKCIIPIRMLNSCRLEAAQCQPTLEEPSSSWQQGREEGPGASSGPQQWKIHKLFQDSVAVSILVE